MAHNIELTYSDVLVFSFEFIAIALLKFCYMVTAKVAKLKTKLKFPSHLPRRRFWVWYMALWEKTLLFIKNELSKTRWTTIRRWYLIITYQIWCELNTIENKNTIHNRIKALTMCDSIITNVQSWRENIFAFKKYLACYD